MAQASAPSGAPANLTDSPGGGGQAAPSSSAASSLAVNAPQWANGSGNGPYDQAIFQQVKDNIFNPSLTSVSANINENNNLYSNPLASFSY